MSHNMLPRDSAGKVLLLLKHFGRCGRGEQAIAFLNGNGCLRVFILGGRGKRSSIGRKLGDAPLSCSVEGVLQNPPKIPKPLKRKTSLTKTRRRDLGLVGGGFGGSNTLLTV